MFSIRVAVVGDADNGVLTWDMSRLHASMVASNVEGAVIYRMQ